MSGALQQPVNLSLPKSTRSRRMTSHCQSYNYKFQEVLYCHLKFNCCGLDVHKTWIYACIGITDSNNRTEYKQARFSSFTKGLNELCDWLTKYNCADVCMESTGKYWIPVFNILEQHNLWVTLSHPKYTKPMKGNKTDRKDAKWICDLYMCGMVKPSFIPPADIRELRDLVRYRYKLTCMITGEKNRAQISKEQAVKLRQCLDHIDELNKHISEVEQEILRLSDKYEAALNLIRTVPGFDKNPMTAVQVLSEIGGDMSVFPTAKHLVSWAGCCPRNDQSNQKIKSTRISRAGSYFKPVLVQVANALIKSKKHPKFITRYKRIKVRRGHKKAIIAICRMILTAIWHILTDLKPYTPEGFLESRPVKEEKTLTTSQALNLLKLRGYVIKDDPLPTS